MTSEPTTPRRRRLLGLGLRITVAAAALAWTASRLELDALLRAMSSVSAAAFAGAVFVCLASVGVGAVRWLVLLHAYGATTLPSLLFLIRAYLVGVFYNTFLPANVGGDLVRAHVTRRSFPGVGGAYLIVAIERLFGLAGLMLLGATVLLLRPLTTGIDLRFLAVAATGAAVTAVSIPFIGRALGRKLPGKLGEILSALPRVRKAPLLGLVLALSLVTQLCVAIAGHILVASIEPSVALTDSLVLVPLAMAALYLPTVAGLGVREAAFVLFFGLVSVPAETATAAALAFFATQLAIALFGGALHAAAPLSVDANDG